MKRQWAVTVAGLVSASAMLAFVPACGTGDEDEAADEWESATGAITVGSRSVTRLVPASAPTALGNYPADPFGPGGNFEVDTGSDIAQTNFVIGFASLQSAPVNVCGAFTCNGNKTGFLTTVPSNGVTTVQAVAGGRRCRAGDKFRLAYTASTSPIPQATCDTTRQRI